MSKIKVNSIVNKNENGPVEFTKGAIINNGSLNISSSLNVVGVMTASQCILTHANSTGVTTAAFYYGDGSNLTALPTVSTPKIYAYRLLFSYSETFRT
jgi:hypothetical protein